MGAASVLLSNIITVGGGRIGAPVAAIFAGKDLANAITADTKQDVTLHTTSAITGVGLTAGTGLLLTGAAGIASGPIGWGVIGVSVVGMYAAHNLSAKSETLEGMFNPSLDTKRHMIGLAGGQFRHELADPCTGEIDWSNMDTLNKYGVLLAHRMDKLEKSIAANDSYVPDGIRIAYMGDDEGVDARNSYESDLKIAKAAHRELQSQMSAVATYRHAEEESIAALSRLTGGVKREPTLGDLDRDHDGVLTANDAKLLRETLKNDKVSDLFINMLAENKITFADQSLDSIAPQSSMVTFNQSLNRVTGDIPASRYLSAFSQFLANLTEKTGITFGTGSLIGMGAGVVTMFANPVAGVALLAGGALFGEKALDYGKQIFAKSESTQPSVVVSAPVTNHPRDAQTNTAPPPSPGIIPTIVKSNTVSAGVSPS